MGIDEVSTLHIEAQACEDRLHVVVQNVEEEIAVIHVHVILFLLVYGSEGLGSRVLCICRKGVAQYTDGNLAVPILGKVLVKVRRTSLVSSLDQFHLTLVRVDVHGIASLVSSIGNNLLSGILIPGIVGVLTDRHAENVAELRPVAHVSTLVENGRENFCKDAKSTLRTYKQGIGEVLDVNSIQIALVFQNLMEYRVVVLAVDEVVANIALIVEVELNEGEAVEL